MPKGCRNNSCSGCGSSDSCGGCSCNGCNSHNSCGYECNTILAPIKKCKCCGKYYAMIDRCDLYIDCPEGPTGATAGGRSAWIYATVLTNMSADIPLAALQNIPFTTQQSSGITLDVANHTFIFSQTGYYQVSFGASFANITSPQNNITLYYDHIVTGPGGTPIPATQIEITYGRMLTNLPDVIIPVLNISNRLSVVNSPNPAALQSNALSPNFGVAAHITITRIADL